MRLGDNYVLERRARHYLRAVGIGNARGLVDSDLLSIVSFDDRQSWTAGSLGAFSAVLADFLANIDEDFTRNKALLLDYCCPLGPSSPVKCYPTLLVSNYYFYTWFFESLVELCHVPFPIGRLQSFHVDLVSVPQAAHSVPTVL